MGQLGNTLTTYIGSDPVPVVTTRTAGESDTDFIRRHGRAVLARLQGTGAAKLSNTETGVELAPMEGQTLAEFVSDFVDLLLQAA